MREGRWRSGRDEGEEEEGVGGVGLGGCGAGGVGWSYGFGLLALMGFFWWGGIDIEFVSCVGGSLDAVLPDRT